MEPIAILFLLVVLVLTVLFVSRPFFGRQRVRSESNPELSSLLAERERLLTALQELDFDQSLGKIPAGDYPIQREALLKQGAEVLRKLDALPLAAAGKTGTKGPQAESAPRSAARLSDDDLEDLVSKRRTTKKDKTAGFCAKCGKPVFKSDAFCPACGTKLG
jgi:hypothetical protein